MSGGSRVSRIPENVREMIQTMKEMTGNDNEEEIHAMLKECSMDPNEAVQKLLLQDTFHEVKRRGKKKESVNNPEPADSRWRSVPAGQGGRGGRGNYSSRYGAGSGGRNSFLGKENGTYQAFKASPQVAREMKNRGPTPGASSVTGMANGPISTVSGGNSDSHTSQVSGVGDGKWPAVSTSRQTHSGSSKDFNMTVGAREAVCESVASSKDNSAHVTSGAVSTVYSSASHPVLVSFMDSRVPAIGSQRTPIEPDSKPSTESRSNASKLGNKSHGVGKNQHLEFTQSSSLSAHSTSSSSRPSSNYGSRPHQTMGSQKGHGKEWKPKSTSSSVAQGPKIPVASEEPPVSVEFAPCSQPVKSVCNPTEVSAQLQKELENLHVRDAQHVIIPTHIHVPESVRSGLSFGSFDAAFSANSTSVNEAETEKYSESTSDSSQDVEVTMVEHNISNENDLVPVEGREYADNPQSSKNMTESLEHGDTNAPSSSVPDMSDLKQETPTAPLNSAVHTSTFGFGLMPNLLGNTLATFESSNTHGRNASRAPSIAGQHQVDPAGFYGQLYRSGGDSDGHISPFPPSGVAPKYNTSATMIPPQTSQPLQEGGNSLVLPMAGQAALATQATGVVQNSIAVTQQPVPIFRQPAGVHLPHYPPNYIPYGHYFSPFYVPPPAIHQFLNNNAFPQQAQVGSIYPGQASAAAAGLKYPIPQYKPGSNTGNTMPIGVAGSFGPYGSGPVGYNPGSATVAGNSAGNEDIAASQFKENNIYINGQQSEGSAVWIAAPGRDLSSLQANPFYNLPPQGQPVTFPPTQAGHGTFAGVYHPAQAATAGVIHPLLQQSQPMGGVVDMAGATTSVYQQQQHTGVNWPNNY